MGKNNLPNSPTQSARFYSDSPYSNAPKRIVHIHRMKDAVVSIIKTHARFCAVHIAGELTKPRSIDMYTIKVMDSKRVHTPEKATTVGL